MNSRAPEPRSRLARTRWWRSGFAAWLLTAAPLALAEPLTSPEPAPDLDAILHRLVSLAAQDSEMEARFKAGYAFVRTQVTDTLGAEGELKHRETRREVHRPPVAPAREAAATEAETEAPAAARHSRRAYERRDFAINPSLLRRFDFRLAGRETAGGRPVWVIDFVPAAEQPPAHGVKEKFLNRTAGRLRVDVAEGFLASARFRLTEPVHVVGGLVGSLKHCEVALDRERAAEGLWFTRRLSWRLEGRKLFARRLLEHQEDLSDIRRVVAEPETPDATADAR